jgi:hypothetical protein
VCATKLEFPDVLRLRPSVSLFYLKGHMIPLAQGFGFGHLDGRNMHEQVTVIFQLDEAISFLLAEPFYRSICHVVDLLEKGPDALRQ